MLGIRSLISLFLGGPADSLALVKCSYISHVAFWQQSAARLKLAGIKIRELSFSIVISPLITRWDLSGLPEPCARMFPGLSSFRGNDRAEGRGARRPS